MVDPQAMSERTQNSCVGMPRRRATSLPAPQAFPTIAEQGTGLGKHQQGRASNAMPRLKLPKHFFKSWQGWAHY